MTVKTTDGLVSEGIQAWLITDNSRPLNANRSFPGLEIEPVFHNIGILGVPRADQLQGSWPEELAELAGRVCYDSLGVGRSSSDFHKHIREVGHLSVHEHAHLRYLVHGPEEKTLPLFLNRPGVWLRRIGPECLSVTLNPRAILDWDCWVPDVCNPTWNAWVRAAFRLELANLCPQILSREELPDPDEAILTRTSFQSAPNTDEERWITLLLQCSRGCSHEMVRHRFRTAVSQRSTRYVDESESPWVAHPLYGSRNINRTGVAQQAKHFYNIEVHELQIELLDRGLDKLSARKQARGAARGFLGNALQTQLIFSASVAQWHRIFGQRLSDFADAEIRVLMSKALGEVRKSGFNGLFDTLTTAPAKDGAGVVLV